MFPFTVINRSKDKVDFISFFGRSSVPLVIAFLLFVGGLILSIIEIEGFPSFMVGMLIAFVPLALYLAYAFLFNWYMMPLLVIKEFTIYEDGTIVLVPRISTRILKEKKRKLSYIEREKSGFYIGKSKTFGFRLPYSGIGKADTDKLELLSKMIKAGTYPSKGSR